MRHANGPGATWVRSFVGVGFCGGLTTFSTWMVESVLLTRAGDTGIAATYLAVSLAAGLLAVAGGVALARRVFPRAPVPTYDPERDEEGAPVQADGSDKHAAAADRTSRGRCCF